MAAPGRPAPWGAPSVRLEIASYPGRSGRPGWAGGHRGGLSPRTSLHDRVADVYTYMLPTW